MYTSDNWVVIKVGGSNPHYRVLAGTSGGYLDGDSWRLNSGVVSVQDEGSYFLFFGSSGSCYKCPKSSYGLRMNNAYVWGQVKERHKGLVELMEEDTDWLTLDWLIKE